MMGTRGKELPTSIVESKGQPMVASDPTLSQVANSLSGSEYVSTTLSVPAPSVQDHLATNSHGAHVNRPLRTQLPLGGSHTTPIANMMEEMQGRFAQLDRTQRRQLLEWMMSNLDGGDLVSRIQSQPLPAAALPTVLPTQLPPPPQQTTVVPAAVPQPQQQTQPSQQMSSQSQQSQQSYPRSDVLTNQAYPASISQLPWSGSLPPGAEVLTVAVPGMNFETSSITTGSTINYVPLVASQSATGVTYATPMYTADLPTSGEQGSFTQVARQGPNSGLPQGARVIAEATITNNREASVIIPGSSTVNSSLASQILDSANIVSVANAMMVAEGGDLSKVTINQNIADPNTGTSDMIVIKQLDKLNENTDRIEASMNEDAAAVASVSNTVNEDSKPLILTKIEKDSPQDAATDDQTPRRDLATSRARKRKQRRRSPCNECKKYFHLVRDDSKKIRIWREKTHICNICNKVFRTRAHLKVHERIHSGVKPYLCSICNKGFAQSSAAKAHTLLHAMPKPFVCPVCGKAVTTKGNLKLHMALHSGARPFTCTHCQKTFPRKSNLDQHVLVHTGEKPFPCQYCGKKFRTATSKNTHERIHTGEKPFVCKYCNKAFSDKRNLTSHEKIHTGGYPCTRCDKHFSDRRRLKSHVCPGQMHQQPIQLQQQQHQQQQQQQQQQQHQQGPVVMTQL